MFCLATYIVDQMHLPVHDGVQPLQCDDLLRSVWETRYIMLVAAVVVAIAIIINVARNGCRAFLGVRLCWYCISCVRHSF